MSVSTTTILLQWENHILPMKTEELFSIIVGDYTRDMKSTVLDCVLSSIETANFPASTKEYLLDQLFLSWMHMQKDMIIAMLNTLFQLTQSFKENKHGTTS